MTLVIGHRNPGDEQEAAINKEKSLTLFAVAACQGCLSSVTVLRGRARRRSARWRRWAGRRRRAPVIRSCGRSPLAHYYRAWRRPNDLPGVAFGRRRAWPAMGGRRRSGAPGRLGGGVGYRREFARAQHCHVRGACPRQPEYDCDHKCQDCKNKPHTTLPQDLRGPFLISKGV